MPRITQAIPSLTPEFEAFLERLLNDDAFFELAATDFDAALRVEGLSRSDRTLARTDWSGLMRMLSAVRFAQLEEAQQSPQDEVVSRRDLFNAVFAIGEKASPVAGRDTGRQTGYNQNWDNHGGRTATTDRGTHKVYPLQPGGPLMSPAEALTVAKRAGSLAILRARLKG